MGLSIKGSSIGGRGYPDVRGFLPGGGSGAANIWIRDVGDVSMHREDYGRISPLADNPTDRAVANTVGGW